MIGLTFALGSGAVAAPGAPDKTADPPPARRFSLEVRQQQWTYSPHQYGDALFFCCENGRLRDADGNTPAWVLSFGLSEHWDLRLAHRSLTLHSATYEVVNLNGSQIYQFDELDREDSSAVAERIFRPATVWELIVGLGLRRLRTERDFTHSSYLTREILATRGVVLAFAAELRPYRGLLVGGRLEGFFLRGPYYSEYATVSFGHGYNYAYKEAVAPGTKAYRLGYDVDLHAGWSPLPGATVLVGFHNTFHWFRANNSNVITTPYEAFTFTAPPTTWIPDRVSGFYLGARFEL